MFYGKKIYVRATVHKLVSGGTGYRSVHCIILFLSLVMSDNNLFLNFIICSGVNVPMIDYNR